MLHILKQLYFILGSTSKVASYLHYSDRHLRNIRRKLEQGTPLNPRVELWIKSKFDLLNNATASQKAGK